MKHHTLNIKHLHIEKPKSIIHTIIHNIKTKPFFKQLDKDIHKTISNPLNKGLKKLEHSTIKNFKKIEHTTLNSVKHIEKEAAKEVKHIEHSTISGLKIAEHSTISGLKKAEHSTISGLKKAEHSTISGLKKAEHLTVNEVKKVETDIKKESKIIAKEIKTVSLSTISNFDNKIIKPVEKVIKKPNTIFKRKEKPVIHTENNILITKPIEQDPESFFKYLNFSI
jgi:predicted phage tail protein